MPFPAGKRHFSFPLVDPLTFERYIDKAGTSLRLGYTTGTCAALAARAATRLLLAGIAEESVFLLTPKGIPVEATVRDAAVSEGIARCAVRKDAGDDPDVTDGILVYATVRKIDGGRVLVDGGVGVGRVTRPGLDQPVGAAAINSVPREMIIREVWEICEECGYGGGVEVIVSIPDGGKIAARTFNASLGIQGGLSIIGTSGIVEPMSTQAMLDAMRVEMNVLRSEGADMVIVTPGNYGEQFLHTMPALRDRPYVKCSNHVGEAVDAAVRLGFGNMLVVGHIGKLIKLAGGVMDTHSRVADCRLELVALHAALAGMEAVGLRRILDAATVDDGLANAGGLREAIMRGVLEQADRYLARRAGGIMTVGVIMFSNRLGLLGVSEKAGGILSVLERGDA